MRRLTVFLSLAFVVLVGLLALHAQPVVIAQEATPSSDMAPEGATFEPLGFAQGVTWPSPADVIVARFTLDAGAGFPLAPNDPTNTVLVIEAGTFTISVVELPWTITRGAAVHEMLATPETDAYSADMSSVIEEVAIGVEATLAAGDVAYIPGSVNGEVRNDGQERAEALLFIVGPPEAMLSATPEP
jgi:hypothetical protein